MRTLMLNALLVGTVFVAMQASLAEGKPLSDKDAATLYEQATKMITTAVSDPTAIQLSKEPANMAIVRMGSLLTADQLAHIDMSKLDRDSLVLCKSVLIGIKSTLRVKDSDSTPFECIMEQQNSAKSEDKGFQLSSSFAILYLRVGDETLRVAPRLVEQYKVGWRPNKPSRNGFAIAVQTLIRDLKLHRPYKAGPYGEPIFESPEGSGSNSRPSSTSENARRR
jgi:hypothetical protein